MKKRHGRLDELRSLIYRSISPAKNRRRQVAIVKDQLDINDYPSFVDMIHSNQSLKNLVVVSEFPRFGRIKKVPLIVLNARNIKKELVWVASVLKKYELELKDFVHLKNEYYENVYSSELDRAEEIIDEIENKFGYSLWLVRSKIYVYKEKYGQKKQQEYVESLVENGNYQNDLELMQILNYSNAVEDNKEYQEHKKTITDIFDNYVNLNKTNVLHTIFRIVPEEILDVEDLYPLIAQDEIKTIIDRYESFVFTLVWSLVNEQIDYSIADKVIQIFSIEEELILKNVKKYIGLFRGENIIIPDYSDYNNYTIGNYEIFINGNYKNLNLSASALANLDEDSDFKNKKLIDKIILSIRNILLNKNQSNEMDFIQKNNLINFGSYYSYQILSVLHNLKKNMKKNLEKIIFLDSNPKSLVNIVSDLNISLDEDVISKNISLSLLWAYKNKDIESLLMIKDNLPALRYNNYLGMIYIHYGKYFEAKECFEFNLLNGNDYSQKQARMNLLETYIRLDDKLKILEIFSEDIVNNGFIDSRYDVLKFFESNFRNRDLYKELDFSILVDYLKKNNEINYLFDINLSDLMECILDDNCVDTPSELLEHMEGRANLLLSYYFRNTCVTNILDSLLIFDSQDEVDNERIKICQILIILDPDNSKTYRSEIAQLTKNMEVNKLFTVVETGRIYVDTDGIKSLLWDSISKSLLKCKEALNSPSAEVSSKFKNILNTIYKDQYPVLKGVYLPENEIEEFYFYIVRNVIDNFYFNPAYGLDTNISTAIRHGWFGGYITAPLIDYEILLSKNGGKYNLTDFWNQAIIIIGSKESHKLEKEIISFSQKLDNIIVDYLENKLQISSIDSTNKNSFFNIFWTKDQHDEVIDFITEFTTTDEIFEKIFSICWRKVEENLNVIREDLKINSNIIKANLDKILQILSTSESRDKLSLYLDTIVNAREKLHENFETMCGWFFLSNDLGIEKFEVENAFLVCKKQIENCYGARIPNIKFNSELIELPGLYFEGICKIMFLLLQNVVIHNDNSSDLNVDLSLNFENSILSITCSNLIDENLNFEEFELKLFEAQKNLTVNRAREEGGSGLSKIKVIAEFDFNKDFDIKLNISTDRIFSARIDVSNIDDLYN
ncbi:hypothetical protein QDT42_11370 [Acinetobacter baumannii]|uniref:hypothetical protein n=1 Tax=Acinetobacter baumannii TaxID=470 RepID=UPI002449EADF|nr:hypothetical protein [Acinetobacter baumannii]MDH2621146.1 hypothetical protein [Acinetobacter baumannii]